MCLIITHIPFLVLTRPKLFKNVSNGIFNSLCFIDELEKLYYTNSVNKIKTKIHSQVRTNIDYLCLHIGWFTSWGNFPVVLFLMVKGW